MHEPFREVAGAILIGTCKRLLLQQRDDIPGILYPGMIGLFGGHREGRETFEDCIRRELREELGLTLTMSDLQPFARLQAQLSGGQGIDAAYFVVRNIDAAALVVMEGSLLTVEIAHVGALLARMTPSACYIMKLFALRDAC